MAPNDDRADPSAEQLLIGREVHAAEQNVGKALLGYLGGAVLTAWLLYRDCGPILLVWLALSATFCIPRIALSFSIARRAPRPLTLRDRHRFWLYSVAAAIAMTGVPLWLIAQTEGFIGAYFLAFSVGVYLVGCFVHAPVFGAAVAYMVTQLVIATLSFAITGYTRQNLILNLAFVVMTGTTFLVVRQFSMLFARDVLQGDALQQKSDALQQQADVIGLLLKEHEEQSSDWLWQTDGAGRVQEPSGRFCEAVRLTAAQMDGMAFDALVTCDATDGNQDARAAMDAHVAARHSFRDLVLPLTIAEESRWWSVSGRPSFGADGGFLGYRGVIADITAMKVAQARVLHLAHHDALTDLPNRTYFREHLGRALDGREPSLAVVSIDLDYFKPINDRYGHPLGDAVLIAVAKRLRACVGESGVVARFGGDEFALNIRRGKPDEVEVLCRRIIAALNEPIMTEGIVATLGCSMGVAFAPLDGTTTDELIKNADTALYRAKTEGRGTFRFFAAAMDEGLQQRQQTIQDLRSALPNGELELFYQPYVDSQSGHVTGCEALLRWNHPVRGLVSPAEFIPLAEESGLILSIGAWVIREACREAARWPDGQRVSLNISPVQFRDRDLASCIAAALWESGLPPERLEIEVTETVLVIDADAALAILGAIRSLGVRVALDDFGTGYSSLSYLRYFPFDKIKIDQSFVRDLDTRRDSQIIVQAIRDIARGLNMTITAEGVETSRQAELLRATGCQELQGYLFSRPRQVADLRPLLQRRLAA
jgi:diguanylate cyclase (GGDEF)-like protein